MKIKETQAIRWVKYNDFNYIEKKLKTEQTYTWQQLPGSSASRVQRSSP